MNHDFQGTGWAFPPRFSRETGGAMMSSGVVDIEQSLAILFSTLPGERVMLPGYGASVRDLLFDAMDTGTQTLLFDRITTAILLHEARIEVIELKLDTRALTDGLVYLELTYRPRTTNSRFNFVYPFYLAEGSQIQNS